MQLFWNFTVQFPSAVHTHFCTWIVIYLEVLKYVHPVLKVNLRVASANIKVWIFVVRWKTNPGR